MVSRVSVNLIGGLGLSASLSGATFVAGFVVAAAPF